MSQSIRVALVEDQSVTREGLSMLIGGSPGFEICGQYGSMEDAIEPVLAGPPDVLLADIGLPGMSGIEGVRRIHELMPALPILMLTVHGDSDSVFSAVCAGACGYLLKETAPARLLESIRELYEGGAPMSPGIARKVVLMFQKTAPPREDLQLSARQLEILRMLAEGHSYKACAATLDVGIDTVRSHVRKIYERLHVHSRSEAVWKALHGGLLRNKPM
ncbi:MAG TPA: response regulator transcription factor [Bryobacteraceae bacterium]|nr:response regulator transcription factor [Bryobacteraceae bacterium]